MEINNLGFMNMENYRMSAMTGVNTPQGNFEEVMRRTAARQDAVINGEDSEWDGRRTASSGIDKNDKLYQMCLELETFLVKNLLSSMRNTVQKSGFIDEGFAGKIYEDMLYDEYAKELTKHSGFGLAEAAYNQLKSIGG